MRDNERRQNSHVILTGGTIPSNNNEWSDPVFLWTMGV